MRFIEFLAIAAIVAIGPVAAVAIGLAVGRAIAGLL